MESAYIFLLIALAFGVAFGVVINRARWIAGVISAAVPLSTIVGSYVTRSRDELVDTVIFASPFLITVPLGYFAAGYAGASIGNRFNLSRPSAEREAALVSLGKRARVIATVVFALIFVSYMFAHFLHSS